MLLQYYRKKANITQEKLAKELKVSRSAISMWENDLSEPDNAAIKQIAEILDISIDDLLGHKTKKKGTKIPVLGNVAAGIPIDAVTDIEDYEEIDEKMAIAGEFVGLKIKGDSMEPLISQGDTVIVKIQSYANDGDIAIVFANGAEATCKKIKKTPDGIILLSINPAYEPMFYSKKDIETLPVRIFGVVKEQRRKY